MTPGPRGDCRLANNPRPAAIVLATGSVQRIPITASRILFELTALVLGRCEPVMNPPDGSWEMRGSVIRTRPLDFTGRKRFFPAS